MGHNCYGNCPPNLFILTQQRRRYHAMVCRGPAVHLLIVAASGSDIHRTSFDNALTFALMCRVPQGLPLLLYLPRVEAWAYSQVHLEADQAEEEAAAVRQMQQPAAAMPFRWSSVPQCHLCSGA